MGSLPDNYVNAYVSVGQQRRTVDIGNISQAFIIARLTELGHVVFMPLSGQERYDLVVDRDGELFRIECKTARPRKGCIEFWTSSSHKNGRVRKDYRDVADVFVVYYPQTQKVYWVPVKDVPITKCQMRIDDRKRGNGHEIRWAKDYEL